ncbi:MAG: TPM domain-containing protein [Planctomycetota bacterium]|nr:MAG: TPM domain-containing protein [Planctomycetota bacterium]
MLESICCTNWWPVAWMVVLASAVAVPAPGQDPLPAVMADSQQRVFVSGIPDTFDDLRAEIERVHRDTNRDYRVIIVGDVGAEGRSARQVLDGILERWGREAAAGSSTTAFDPAQDVLIVVDVNGHRLAMHAPLSLETQSGLDPETIQRELIEKVFRPQAQDGRIDRGLVGLVKSTEAWVKERIDLKVARQQRDRVFRTQTLPLATAGLAGLAGLGWLLAQRSRHERRLRVATEKLATFKQEVVALSDLIDGQRERHRMLPHSDPDFVTPMEGQTRETYEGVQASLGRYRERWLSLMEVWEKADRAIKSESSLGTSRAEEAIALLDSAEARPPLAEVAAECRTPLDTLEAAHETARGLAADVEAALGTAGKRLAGFAARGRSAASFQGTTADIARGLGLSKQNLESDPVLAHGQLEEARIKLAATVARIDAFEAADDRRGRGGEAAAHLDQQIRAKRAEGWLLSEPGADPAVQVQAAREQEALAGQLLDAGEIEAALKNIEAAEKNVSEGAALLENVVAAKTRVEELLPGCIARIEVLAGRRAGSLRALEHLGGAYAESSWAEVADNVAKADEGLSRARAMVAEAQAASTPHRQSFLRGLALVEEAVRQLDWVESCHAAVSDRRAELDNLRASLPEKLATVNGRVGAIGRRLQQESTDRVRANEQCREAGRLVEVAGRGLAMQQPDLPRTGQVIEAADVAAGRAEQLADDDGRLARQGFAEIEQADKQVRSVASWYAEGVKPDVRSAVAALEDAKGLLTRQRYEDAIKAASDSQRLSGEAQAVASAEAQSRRHAREQEVRRRQMEESYVRMSRGSGPWLVQLPGGTLAGPDPWRTLPMGGSGGQRTQGQGPSSHSAGGGWSTRTSEGSW